MSYGLAAILLSSCAEPPPPEPVSPIQTYLDLIGGTETQLASGVSMGLLYVHPIRKRSCKLMHVRLARKIYNGIEHSWEPEQLIELEHIVKAPPERRQIGTYPIFFDMVADSSYRIDALSCEAYDKSVTTQYQTFAEFDSSPGALSYIGDFTQNRLAEGVDIYTWDQDLEAAKDRLSGDSPELLSAVSLAVVKPFSFENFDGTRVNAQELLDNKALSGDYFTLSQTLKMQADDALRPFFGYFPDIALPATDTKDLKNTKTALKSSLDLALLRLDIHADFQAILEAGKSYQVARDYIHSRLEWVNAERIRSYSAERYPGTNFQGNQATIVNSKQQHASYKAYLSKHGLTDLIGKQISKERQEARAAWKAELERMPYVLVTRFSSQTTGVKRDRVQNVMDDYIPAKYASLKLEFLALAEAKDLPPAETRRLGRLIDAAQRDEQIIVNELVSEFLQDDLSKNDAYHQARQDFDQGWQLILALLNIA